MALQNTDLFIVERAGVQYNMTADQIADFVGAVRDFTAADYKTLTGATYPDASEIKTGDRVFVADATGGTTVDAGWAVYRYNGTSYEKIQEQESMDLVVVANTNLGVISGAASITITNDNGTDAIVPLADATNAGLMSPSQFNNQHVPTVTGLTAASNPIVIDSSTQSLTFSITPLTPLP